MTIMNKRYTMSCNHAPLKTAEVKNKCSYTSFPLHRENVTCLPASIIKSFRSHYGPAVESASNRNECQEYFLEVKAAGE